MECTYTVDLPPRKDGAERDGMRPTLFASEFEVGGNVDGGWGGWAGLGIDTCPTAVDDESVDLVRVCVACGMGVVVAVPIDCVG